MVLTPKRSNAVFITRNALFLTPRTRGLCGIYDRPLSRDVICENRRYPAFAGRQAAGTFLTEFSELCPADYADLR